jgi:elongin-A
LLEQNAREVDEDAERMKQALLGLDAEKAKHCSKVVDTRKMRLPQEKPTATQKYASHDRKMGGLAPVFVLDKNPSRRQAYPYDKGARWTFQKPNIPRQMAKKSALPVVRRNEALCVPTHRLNNRASQVSKAPRSLIEDYKQLPSLQGSRPPNSTDATMPERPNERGAPAAPLSNHSRRDVNPKSQRPYTPSPALSPGRSTAKPVSSNARLNHVVSTAKSSPSPPEENRPRVPTKPLPKMSNLSLNPRHGQMASPQPISRKRPTSVDPSPLRQKKTRVA